MSDILLTAPKRMKIMAMDADKRFVFASEFFVKSLDSTQRPAVIVEILDDEYPATAASVEYPVENFKLTIESHKYGQGAQRETHQMETELRQLSVSLLKYFQARTTLSFSNELGRETSKLGPLAGVRNMRIARRGLMGLLKAGAEGGGFWGAEFNVTIETVAGALSQIY